VCVRDGARLARHPPSRNRWKPCTSHGTRVSDLAEQARVTKQSAGFLVEQLETAGYVERVPDPADRRARLVRLTSRADRVVETANAEVERVLAGVGRPRGGGSAPAGARDTAGPARLH
jgi:DNA-binding MarR family transcriptional regulator